MFRYQQLAGDRVEAQPGSPPIVILPGFGNCSEDYTAPFGNEEAAIAAVLKVSLCARPVGWLGVSAAAVLEAGLA